jgi:hypothetical protein
VKALNTASPKAATRPLASNDNPAILVISIMAIPSGWSPLVVWVLYRAIPSLAAR